MSKKKRLIDPQLEVRWAEQQRELADRVAYIQTQLRTRRERIERRRRLLHRLSLGLFGRAEAA